MKKEYETPELDMIMLEHEDVIRTSNETTPYPVSVIGE